MNTHPNILIISLDHSTKRRQNLGQQLEQKQLPYTVISAVDGTKLKEHELGNLYCRHAALKHHGRGLLKNEIACALSHIKCYQHIIDNNLASAIILEDDAILLSNFKEVSQALFTKVNPNKANVTLLNFHKYYSPLFKDPITENSNSHKITPIWTNAWGAYGYHITQQAAQNLRNYYSKIWHVIDYWDYLLKEKLVQTACIVPYCVDHPPFNIDSSEVGNRSFSKNKVNKRPLQGYLIKQFSNVLKAIHIIKKQQR